MKTDNFYIALYDSQTNIISFPYFVDEFDSPPKPCTLGRGLTDYVLRTGTNMLVDAELDLKLREQGVTDLIGPSTEIWLGVALKIKNKPIGVIVVQDYDDKTTYGEEEKQILTYVSEQIASAIRKKMDDKELKHYSEELKELNASKDRFFSIIAHDLRSPFHGLLGLANILHTEKNRLSPEEIDYYLEEIYSSTSNLYSLIENLLDWSRLQTHKTPFKPKKLNVHDLIADVEEVLRSNRNLKSIKFENLVNNTINVTADEDMIRSLFHNLISNAIKFTFNNGKIKITANIIDESMVKFTVSDSGIGIPKEKLEKLFSIDKNVSSPGTNKERGTGLGLLLCKDIAEKHETEIEIDSRPGNGAKFSFTLKLA
jgi:K+-sensing histidine kinase KdpD